MSGLVIGAVLVGALFVGSIAVWGAPFLGIPIVLLAGGIGFLVTTGKRARAKRDIQRFRNQADV